MKRKMADYPDWKNVESKTIFTKHFDNPDFKGYISLLTASKVSKPVVKKQRHKKVVVCDTNFKLLEIYPETNKNVSVIVTITDTDDILYWFFDIANDSGITKEGIPYIDDLYLDIMYFPNGELRIVDTEDLEAALTHNQITKEQYDLAYKISNELVLAINGKVNELTEFTKKYYKLMTV